MSWRFRKSFTVVPGLRLNLSKSGLSASIGVAPFTLNVKSKGLTGTASIPGTGISHKETFRFERPSELRVPASGLNGQPPPVREVAPSPGLVQHVHSASTERMTSERLAAVKELVQMAYQQHASIESDLGEARTSEKEAQARLNSWDSGFLLKRVLPRKFAARRELAKTETARVTELEEQLQLSLISTQIELEAPQAELFYQMRDAFAGMSESQAIWDVKTKQTTNRIQERTTAHERISRERVRFNLAECDLLVWEQKVPHLANAKGGDLYLYPGFMLYRAARQAFSLIDYHDVVVKPGLVQFQENEKVPSDSQIVGQAWFKANKDGSRDKRFNGNYKIPVARYAELSLRSGNGLWEEFHLSNPDNVFHFVAALQMFTKSFSALPVAA